jgi:predicted transcriptional regulator of viral defense system
MRNNQINGLHDSADLKKIVKNHQSLSIIDFSNTELNVNKNKLRNLGAASLVEGILESTKNGCSLISSINLSYNYLTHECLPTFSRLRNP